MCTSIFDNCARMDITDHYCIGWDSSKRLVWTLQKCSDAAFCNRLMGSVDEGYMIDPASVKIAGSKLLCRVKNAEIPEVDLELTLTSYGSFIRLHVNEDASKGRFQVPGVLQKELTESESAWETSKAAAGYALLKLGSADIRLKYKPLELTVDIAGKPAIVFNGRHMFNFEHLRQKKVRHHCCHKDCLAITQQRHPLQNCPAACRSQAGIPARG